MFQRILFTLNKYLFFYYFIHMKMKKMLIGAFLWMFAVAGIAVLPNHANASDDDYGSFNQAQWDAWKGRAQQDQQYQAEVAWVGTMQKDSLIKTIQTAINWVLWILSLIALCLCLWGGFQMMTSGWDSKKYEAGINLLKWAAIGLAVIAVSWLIVSLIFYVINWSITVDKDTQQQ